MNKKLILFFVFCLGMVLFFRNSHEKDDAKENTTPSIVTINAPSSLDMDKKEESKTIEQASAKIIPRDQTRLSLIEIQSKEKEAAQTQPTSDDYVRSATELFEQGKSREGALFLATAAIQMAGYSDGISSPQEFAEVCQVLDRLERTVPIGKEYYLLKAKFLERAQEEQEANKQIGLFEASTQLSGADRPCEYLDIYVEGNNSNLVKTYAKKCALSANRSEYTSVIQQAIENIKNHLGLEESQQLKKQIES